MVVQAIPTYDMSIFKFPDNLCKEIDSLLRNYWWGASQNENKFCWTKWDNMCQMKTKGGIGFRNMNVFMRLY